MVGSKNVGYNIDIMCHSVCQVVNLIMDYSYGFLLICTTLAGQIVAQLDVSLTLNICES